MKKIICIVGASGTGKTTITNYIDSKYKIKAIQSHTDRPKRYKNETGHTFLSKKDFDKLKQDEMIAYTEINNYRYCCLKSDVNDLNTYVIDEKGILMLEKNPDYNIVKILIKRPDPLIKINKERKDRDKERIKLKDSYFDFIVNNIFLEDTKNQIDNILTQIV